MSELSPKLVIITVAVSLRSKFLEGFALQKWRVDPAAHVNGCATHVCSNILGFVALVTEFWSDYGLFLLCCV